MNVTVLTFCLLWDDLYVTVVAIARVCKAHISITCVSHVLRSLQTSHSVALTQHELDVSVFFFFLALCSISSDHVSKSVHHKMECEGQRSQDRGCQMKSKKDKPGLVGYVYNPGT